MILEWDNPWQLITPEGTLPFNAEASVGTTPLGYYVLDRTRCSAGAARRVTRTNLPQADGEITHRKFKSGYVIELNVQFWETIGEGAVPACGGVLRQMGDLLDLHLNAIENADGRIMWEPTSWPASGPTLSQRMVDKVRSLGPSGQGDSGFVSVVVEQDAESPLVVATFALLSPLPYAEDFTQTTTNIYPSAVLHNGGNTNFYPVMQVHGPASSFAITNASVTDENGNALSLVYDSTLPGAVTIGSGHYAEIDFFRQTIFLDGHFDNLSAGIDVTLSDFFPLVPGDNALSVGAYTGSQVDVLWQNAYI